MTAPTELINLIRGERSVFIKTDNYVPAHITANEGEKIAATWTEDKLRDYLYGEAMLNNRNGGAFDNGKTVSIFIGEAKYHGWVRHYRISKVNELSTWTYHWERIA